jgi:hypothetical protein
MTVVIETCQRCGSPKLTRVLARCSDMCGIDLAGKHSHGYVPLGIGGGDDVHFLDCLDYGQIQSTGNVPPTAIVGG